MATIAEKKAGVPQINLSFEDEDEEYYVSSPPATSPPSISPKAALLPRVHLSSDDDEDDHEDDNENNIEDECHPYVSSSPISISSSSCSTTTSSSPSPSPSPSFSTPSCPPASTEEEGGEGKLKLEPADRNTDFFWPKGVRPEYLQGPPQIIIDVADNYNTGYEVATINGPRGQVVPKIIVGLH